VDRASLIRLRQQPGYPTFLGAATLARLADEMFSVAVVLLVLERTGSAALAGATVAAITLPSVFTGPLLGAWLDLTGRRRRLMVLDQTVISVALVGMVLIAGHGPDVLVPLLGLAAGLTYPLSFGGFTSMIPMLVPGELLAPANSIEASSFNFALIVGPALAGTISAAASPSAAIFTEVALTLASLALIVAIPGIDGHDRPGAGRSMRSVVRDGLARIVNTPALRGITAAGSLGMAGMGVLVVAFPFFAVEQLGAERSAAGYLWAAFAAGSMAGALVGTRAQTRWPPERVVIAGLFLTGAVMVAWPLAGSLPVALGLVAVAGMADGPALAATFATRQRYVPQELHGQVFTTAAGIKVGSLSFGAALAGPVVTGLGSGGAVLVAAGMQFAAAAVGLTLMRLPIRARAVAGAAPGAP
jgi:predicted MFS family arabinose efflux permease